jgi:hypothetical protein
MPACTQSRRLLDRLPRHTKTWSIVGDGGLSERRLTPWGPWAYHEIRSQLWSDLCHEYTQSVGLRFGAGFRLGWSWTWKRFFDGRKPETIPGPL